MIYRRREQRIKWTVYLRKSTVERLNKIVEKSGFYKSDVIDTALLEYIERCENK